MTTPTTTTLNHLPTDRPICYVDRTRSTLVVRIYSGCLSPRRLSYLLELLDDHRFTVRQRTIGRFEEHELEIRSASDPRLTLPMLLSREFGVRYVTGCPDDSVARLSLATVLKLDSGRYHLIEREIR